MRYIASIREHGQAAGICKVVPPSTWKLPPGKYHERPFPTKRQAIHRLKEGVPYGTGGHYTRSSYRDMANKFAAER